MGKLSLAETFPFGVWTSDDSVSRWELDFNENGCNWTERTAAGAHLLRVAPLKRTATGWRIERPNDAGVLAFLGASSALSQAILGRNPQPSFLELTVQVDAVAGTWNGLRWSVDAAGNLSGIDQPGASSTRESFRLVRHGDDRQYYVVPKGQVTFDQEGMEGIAAFHSRWLHHPSDVSGVTLGRGYDMKTRKAASVAADLRTAGVADKLATDLSAGAGLSGQAATDFVTRQRERLGNLSPGQQKRLFVNVYDEIEADVRRISEEAQVVQNYGTVNFGTVDQRILDVIVDLRFRGDYSPVTRQLVQKPFARNDREGLLAVIKKRDSWQSVPEARFQARVAHLEGAG